MKILLYIDPWVTIYDKPEFKYNWLKSFLKSPIKNLVTTKAQVKAIYSDILDGSDIKEEYGLIDFIDIEQSELNSIFTDSNDYVTNQRSQTINNKSKQLNELIKNKLGDFIPDVILIISGSAKYLKYAFPESLIILQESGIFGRPPYPTSLYFDCCASMDESFLLKYEKELIYYYIDETEKSFLKEIRKHFIQALDKYNPYKKIITNYRKKFPNIILLSLQRFEAPLFRTQCEFRDQIEYIKYIFDNVDSDIGVIVTEHSKDNILIYKPIYDYFKNKYENFIYLKETEIYPNSSQFLLQLTDGIITVSSTVGMQALINKKPLFVPSDTSYLKAFSDGSDMKEIGTILKNKEYKDKDGSLYYLLTRYYILGNYFKDSEWFFGFLSRSLNNFRKGIDFSFYNRIDSDENLLKNICDKKFIKIFKKQMKDAKKTAKKAK